jgi:hypothetical protein
LQNVIVRENGFSRFSKILHSINEIGETGKSKKYRPRKTFAEQWLDNPDALPLVSVPNASTKRMASGKYAGRKME